jgi:hypothetical protein
MITELDYWALWVANTIDWLRRGNPQVAKMFVDAMIEHLRIVRASRESS